MHSKQELKNFLSEISENAEFPLFNYISPEKYTILIKCRVESNREAQFYSEYASEWVKKFTKFTRTGWIVRSSFPNLIRLVYRKMFVCHLSNFNKKSPEEARTKNRDCKAKIDFKMKFINRHTIRNDKWLKEGLNLNIYIFFMHSHGIKARESFNKLKCSPDIDEMFYKYFASGHTVSSAKNYHELTLLSNFGGACEDFTTNSERNPSMHHVSYLYGKKKKEYSNLDIANIMAEKEKAIEELGGVLRYSDNFRVTVVITPFMKNVLTGLDLDYVIIDSTPIKDGVASFFFVPTPLGALPIACALHSHTTESSYSQAFFSTKLLLENQTLKTFEPKKIMINMIDEQNHALDAIFSDKILFISRASMIEEIWKTICLAETKIEAKYRQTLMLSFNSLLHAGSLEEATLFHADLMDIQQVEAAPLLKALLTDLGNNLEDYTEQGQNKIIDISIRTLKQFLWCKCQAFNSLIMIDVLINILDKHWCNILHAHLKNRLIVETYTKFLPKNRNVINSLEDLKVTDQEYRFDTQTRAGRSTYVTFRGDTMCCDCAKGRRGRLCEHLCAVLHFIELNTFIPEDKREFYTALAGEDTVKVEPKLDDEELVDGIGETTSNEDQAEDLYFIVKQEIEHNDPLDNTTNTEENSVNNSLQMNTDNIRQKYTNALRALNDEFRRLNKVFRNNPSASNLDTMGRLARELSKIRPVEQIKFSNMDVE